MTTAFGTGLHRHQYRDFARGPTAPFAWLSLTPDIGIIELNHTAKVVTGIAVLHGLSDLMTPAPGRGIGDAQVILELTGRGARGSGGHQKDRPEPVPQGFPRLVEYGMGREGGLMVTVLALILSPRWDEPGLIVAAAGTAVAIRPLSFDEIPHAITLGAKPPSELSRCH